MRTTLLLSATLFALLLCRAASPAPQDDAGTGAVFSGEERVTAVDVVVAFDQGRMKKWSSGRGAPKKLETADFQVLYGGEPRPVVAVEGAGEPWTTVVWFDQAMTGSFELAWAADLLTQHVDELTGLGRVEVVVADPVPRIELAATRDAEALRAVLSQIALRSSQLVASPETRTSTPRPELLAMRAEFLAEALHPTPAVDPEALARWVVSEEVRIARRGQDALLGYLVDRAGEGPRRAVVVVSSGYDLRPGLFYLPAVGLDDEAFAGSTAHLADETDALGRTLAGYGWVVVPVVPPPPDPEIRRGPRLGQWRLHPLGAAREGERDVGKAEAYLELALAHRGRGSPDDAEDAFKKALHHFYGDPRTADRQAFVLLELGELQAQLGKAELAERSFLEARMLDPAQATKRLGPVVALLDPVAPFTVLADATAGSVVRDGKQLTRVLESLGERVRLTYQVAGLATGELYSVSVRHAKVEHRLRAPGWARSATPETVAAARVRGRLSGDSPAGELEVRVRLDPSFAFPDDDGFREGKVTVVVADGSFADSEEVLLRVTAAAGAPDVLARVWHEPPEVLGTDDVIGWFHRRSLRLTPEDSLVTVLVEDLYSGRWGTVLVPVRDPDQEGNDYR